jgi:hypothetical protein
MTFNVLNFFNEEIFWSVLMALCAWSALKWIAQALFVVVADRL